MGLALGLGRASSQLAQAHRAQRSIHSPLVSCVLYISISISMPIPVSFVLVLVVILVAVGDNRAGFLLLLE